MGKTVETQLIVSPHCVNLLCQPIVVVKLEAYAYIGGESMSLTAMFS